MHDIDEFLSGGRQRGILRLARIHHVFTNVVLNNLRDKTIQGASAGVGLLQYRRAFIIRIDGAFDRLDLTPHALNTI